MEGKNKMTKKLEKISIKKLNEIVKSDRGEILGAWGSNAYLKLSIPDSDLEILKNEGGEFYARGTPNLDALASPLNGKRNPVIPLIYGKYITGVNIK